MNNDMVLRVKFCNITSFSMLRRELVLFFNVCTSLLIFKFHIRCLGVLTCKHYKN